MIKFKKYTFYVGFFGIFFLFYLLPNNTSPADIYKWKDKKGRVHYSNRPPAKFRENLKTISDSAKINITPQKIKIQGNGEQQSPTFLLNQGTHVFRGIYEGKSNFIIDLKDNSGQRVKRLFNEIGNYSGRKYVSIKKEGSYFIEAKRAQGIWIVEIYTPSSDEAKKPIAGSSPEPLKTMSVSNLFKVHIKKMVWYKSKGSLQKETLMQPMIKFYVENISNKTISNLRFKFMFYEKGTRKKFDDCSEYVSDLIPGDISENIDASTSRGFVYNGYNLDTIINRGIYDVKIFYQIRSELKLLDTIEFNTQSVF